MKRQDWAELISRKSSIEFATTDNVLSAFCGEIATLPPAEIVSIVRGYNAVSLSERKVVDGIVKILPVLESGKEDAQISETLKVISRKRRNRISGNEENEDQ